MGWEGERASFWNIWLTEPEKVSREGRDWIDAFRFQNSEVVKV